MDWKPDPFAVGGQDFTAEKKSGMGVMRKIFIRLTRTLSASLLLFAAGAACFAAEAPPIIDLMGSQTGQRNPEGLFRLMDENKDQRVDRAEFRFRIMEVFQIRDTNRDDKLSKEELPAINAAAFGVADENRDGKLSGYEFNQARFARFNALDGNKDGFISLDEVRAYVRRMR